MNQSDVIQSAKNRRQSPKMEALEQLAGGIASQFNDILTLINGKARLLLEMEDLGKEASECAMQIYIAGERARRVTSQLLAFSGKQVLQAETIDLNQIIRENAAMLSRLIGESIKLELRLSPKAMPANVDARMLEQILLILGTNARDAMPKGGVLTISSETVTITELESQPSPEASLGNFHCLIVSDTGCGIPHELLPRIFEPFFTTKRLAKRAGLGLASAIGIVRLHKGWINVESQPEIGSTFKIFFPAGVLDHSPVVPSEPATEPAGGETILFAEDETALREMASQVLQRQGYRVLQAASGADALEIWSWHSKKIKLLLTDIVMPDDVTGLQLATELLGQKPSLKVIFCSGFTDGPFAEVLAQKNTIHFLPKPYPLQALLNMVRRALDTE